MRIEPGSNPNKRDSFRLSQCDTVRKRTGDPTVHNRLRTMSAAFRAGVGLRMMGMLGLGVDGESSVVDYGLG